ncbi:hypothetical protein [Pseudomonas kitaguniensis]|nr:hypothetical protein [Pseudomonas kitaguniensis]
MPFAPAPAAPRVLVVDDHRKLAATSKAKGVKRTAGTMGVDLKSELKRES